jgi:type IX secretion system PorP/SprF family membrane protein
MIENNLKIFVILLLLSFFIAESEAQDYIYSQFYANPLYLNPAMAGSEYCPRIIMNYRNQWPSLPQAFVSYGASFDRYSEFLSGGLGLQFNYNKSGEAALSEFYLNGMYAYNFNVSDLMEANLAVQAGLGNRGLNKDSFVFGFDPGAGNPLSDHQENVFYADFATGFLVGYDEKYFIGGAVHHLSQPNISLKTGEVYNLPMKFTVHAGANISSGGSGYRRSSGPELVISPNIMYQRQSAYQQLNLGTYFTYEPFVVGLWYRHAFENPDAVIASLGLQQKNLRLGYSFDYTVSSLALAGGGAHEISVSWVFDCNEKRKRSRAIKCPSF